MVPSVRSTKLSKTKTSAGDRIQIEKDKNRDMFARGRSESQMSWAKTIACSLSDGDGPKWSLDQSFHILVWKEAQAGPGSG